jgi:hypothetical protein
LQTYKVLDKLLKISNSMLKNMFKISDPVWYKNLLKKPTDELVRFAAAVREGLHTSGGL